MAEAELTKDNISVPHRQECPCNLCFSHQAICRLILKDLETDASCPLPVAVKVTVVLYFFVSVRAEMHQNVNGFCAQQRQISTSF